MMGSDAVSAQVHRRRVHLPALVGAVALTVVALLFVAAAPALADDTTAPQVTAFSLSPKTVDTSLSEQTVTATATVTDDQSGVRYVCATFSNGQQSVFRYLGRVSGDALAGTYAATFRLPQGSASGVWHASLNLCDIVGNTRVLSPTSLDTAFGAGSAEVLNVALLSDAGAPRVTAFNISPHTINTDLGSANVTVTATVTDDWAGTDSVSCLLSPPGGGTAVVCSLIRVSGDGLIGVYRGTATLASIAGTWSASLRSRDFLNNSAAVGPVALDAQFGAGSAEVTNLGTTRPGDVNPPQVTAFSITPTEIDTEAGPQTLSVTATLMDDSSGVTMASIFLQPLIGTQLHVVALHPISGGALNGTYAASITLPQGAKEGIWTAGLDVSDKAGNRTSLDCDQLHAVLPDAVGLLIANTATADQVIIDHDWRIQAATGTATFPAGTLVTRQGGGRFAFYEMAAQSFTIEGGVPTTGLAGTPVATLELGIPGLGLSFSKPVTISLEVGDAYNGYQLSILSLGDGESAWANETSSTVLDGRVQFTVSHATKFVASRTSPIPPKPIVTGFSPDSGPVGAKVTVTGSAFSDASAVTFGGITASFHVVADGNIVATVPSGAKSGAIAVTSPGGTGVSTGSFTVARPAITRLTPTSVRRGATITLVGRYFGVRRGTAYVKFGATKCKQYVSWTAARIRCKVPARAKCGRLKVVVTIGGRMSNAKTVTVRR